MRPLLRKIYYSIIEFLALAGGLLVFVMSVLTTGDIIGRDVVGKGIPGCYELVQYLMVFVVFFGVAYLESKKGNVRVELLFTHFPRRMKGAVELVSAIFALFVFGIMLYTSGIYSWESWVERETMYGIKGGPLYVWKFGVPFGCFFMCIELFIGMGRTIKQLIRGSS